MRAALRPAGKNWKIAHLDGGDSLVQLVLWAAHKLARPLIPGSIPDEVQGSEPGLAPGAHKDQHWLDGGVRLEATKSQSQASDCADGSLSRLPLSRPPLMPAAIHVTLVRLS